MKNGTAYSRETVGRDEILDFKLTMLQIMQEGFELTSNQLTDLLERHNILKFLEIGYEYFYSMGEQGILNEIEEYVYSVGGRIK